MLADATASAPAALGTAASDRLVVMAAAALVGAPSLVVLVGLPLASAPYSCSFSAPPSRAADAAAFAAFSFSTSRPDGRRLRRLEVLVLLVASGGLVLVEAPLLPCSLLLLLLVSEFPALASSASLF